MIWTATIPLDIGFGALSVNALYINRIQGGKTLSKIGRKFQRIAVSILVKKWGLQETPDVNHAFKLKLHFYFPSVYTKGWPKKAKNRFKKIDQSNFAKFFQDCVASVSGVDDANHLKLVVEKSEDAENPRVEIVLEDIE